MYKVSVVTPVFNNELFLSECLDSILNQTYPNIELIVIDGGSNDGTLDVIREYLPRINYFISEPDESMYDAINKGIVCSTGEYIMFLNSDDYYYSRTSIEDLMFEITKSRADCIYGDIVIFNQNTKNLKFRKLFGVTFLELLLSNHSTFFPQPTSLFRKAVFSEVGLYCLKYKYASDFEFNLRLLRRDFKVCHLNKFITTFRLHNNSITGSGLIDKERKSILTEYGLLVHNKIFRNIMYYFLWAKYKIKNI